MTTAFLDLSEDQQLLLDTTAKFIDGELPTATARALHDDPAGYQRAWLQASAELGWFCMLVPEECGGGSVSGSPLTDAAMLAEQMGRRIQPGPFVPMNVAAWVLGVHRHPLTAQVAAGETVATWGCLDARGTPDLGDGLVAQRADDGIRVRGVGRLLQDAASADVAVLPARLDDTTVHAVVPLAGPGVVVGPLETLDLGRRFATVDIDALLGDESLLAEPVVGDAVLRALVLNAAETVGAMDELFWMTVAYAKDRIAFGRPIGSFQAIKHVLADVAVLLETAKAGVAAAVLAVERGGSRAADMAHVAAAYVSDSAHELGQQCLQVHGGIGYTWEHDLHLYLRRMRSNAAAYGTATWQRERLCRLHQIGTVGRA